jgi:apolipoprotein D and lipocalin family protein
MNFWVVLAIIIILLLAYYIIFGNYQNRKIMKCTNLPVVNLQKYQGMWYEIARLPNEYQDLTWGVCVNSTANYTLNPDNTLTIVNKCLMGQTEVTANMEAIPGQDTTIYHSIDGPVISPAIFDIRYERQNVSGKYVIMAISPNEENTNYNYALVGTPDISNLWILSRTTTIDPKVMGIFMEIAKKCGFDISKLRFDKNQ